MAANSDQNKQIEQELLNKIKVSLNLKYGSAIPPDIEERVAAEMRLSSDSGYIRLLAIAAAVVDYSATRGYHVGIRGMIGNMLMAHLLGIAACDPLKLGLRYEGCLGLNATQMQDILLNVAPEILAGLRAHLHKLFPDCSILWDPDNRSIDIMCDSDCEYPTVTIYPNERMSLVETAWRRTTGMESFDRDLIVSAYHSTDVCDIPMLDDWLDTDVWNCFIDLGRLLEPESFFGLVKVMGLAWLWHSWFIYSHVQLPLDQFDDLVGTREDIYDICLRHGISEDDALRIFWQATQGNLARDYRDRLAALGLPDISLMTLDAAQHIYPRGQCADHMYWALTILAHKSKLYCCRM